MFKPMGTHGALTLAVLTAGACTSGSEKAAEEMGTAPPAAEVTGAAPMSEFSDASIVELLAVVHAGQIHEAELAQNRTDNEELRRFTEMMMREHRHMAAATGAVGGSNDAAEPGPSAGKTAAGRGGAMSPSGATSALPRITPGPTTVSPAENASPAMEVASPAVMIQQLRQESEHTRMQLQELSGPGFDQAYVERQVRAHQHTLDLLEQRLIPDAQHTELRKLLQHARTTVLAHLKEARRLQLVLGAPH